MWLTGGIAVVLAAVALVVAALVEGGRSPRPRRTGTVTAEELRTADLPIAWRGYGRGHVEALLARAATTLEQAQRYGDLAESTDAGADVPRAGPPAGPPSFLSDAVSSGPGESPGSGEELEDRGGDDAGGLDR